MSYVIVGLGNPGEEYTDTRHNTGRIVLALAIKNFDFCEFKIDKKLFALVANGKIGKESVKALMPETFMNKSGSSLKTLITSEKKAKTLVVIHDDLDLPIGSLRISFNRGAGGHRGVESIIRAIKTEKFIRIKIGISPKTPTGKTKKPKSEKVGDFILGKFKPEEMFELKKVAKKVGEALEVMIKEDVFKAMTDFN
ncbi:MAG: aminoacyl-tRNA hydrolase [Candidatus Paceibacterota bacterium]